jgi:uncharacterized integral membrane protein
MPTYPDGGPGYRGMTGRAGGYVHRMTGDPSYARPDDSAAEPYPDGEPVGRAEPVGRGEPVGRAEPVGRGEPAGRGEPTGRAEPAGRAAPELTIERTRTGGLWVAAIGAAVVILLLLIFVLQNMQQVEVALFGANPDLPLGVALMLAAVLGALTVALLGTARIVQLRLIAKRHRDADRRTRG